MGGGVYSEGDVSISNCYIHLNQSQNFFGGALHVKGESPASRATVNITDSLLASNSADYAGGGIYASYTNLYITRCTISLNVSGSGTAPGGGGVSLESSSAYITDSTFDSNIAARDGGGLYTHTSYGLHISGSTFVDNVAGQDGGGVCMGYGSIFDCRNSTFYGNEADQDGGGIWVWASDALGHNITFCTITENTADADCGDAGGTCDDGNGGGLYLKGDYIDLRGVILVDNYDKSATTVHQQCHFETATFVSAGYNLLDGHAGCETAFPWGLPNVNSDYVVESIYAWVDPLADNGGPTETCRLIRSKIINSGPPDGTDADGNPVLTDQRGMGRVRGGRADIGAFEVDAASGSTLGLLLE